MSVVLARFRFPVGGVAQTPGIYGLGPYPQTVGENFCAKTLVLNKTSV